MFKRCNYLYPNLLVIVLKSVVVIGRTRRNKIIWTKTSWSIIDSHSNYDNNISLSDYSVDINGYRWRMMPYFIIKQYDAPTVLIYANNYIKISSECLLGRGSKHFYGDRVRTCRADNNGTITRWRSAVSNKFARGATDG